MQMKLRVLFLFILVYLLGTNFICVNEEPPFSYKVYGNIANYFEDANDLKNFFEFKLDQVVAEVGCGDGKNIAGLALFTDSMTFYAEDIDAGVISQKKLEKLVAKNAKYKNPIISKCYACIGNEKATNLPDDTFDKIIPSAAFHEFTFMDEMLADIYKKLKPGGKLYILESHCFTKTHKNYSADEAIALLQKANF